MDLKEDVSITAVKRFIVWWNTQFPVDYWWRKKYNIPFNSEKHRKLCLIDAYIEYKEEEMIKESIEDYKRKKDDLEDYKITGNYLKRSEDTMTQEEIDQAFDNMDLSKFNR